MWFNWFRLAQVLYATAALSILIGSAWYSGSHRWVRRILVAWTLLLHAAVSCTFLAYSARLPLLTWLIVVGSIAFTVWMYWLGRHPSMHLVHLINLAVLVILIENYRLRDSAGVGLCGRGWIY